MGPGRLGLVTEGELKGETERETTVNPYEHFQVSLIVHDLIFILIGFAGVAIATFSPPRGPRSKTLCILLFWILAGGGIVGLVTTSAGEINGFENSVRWLEEDLKRDSKVFRDIQEDFQKTLLQ